MEWKSLIAFGWIVIFWLAIFDPVFSIDITILIILGLCLIAIVVVFVLWKRKSDEIDKKLMEFHERQVQLFEDYEKAQQKILDEFAEELKKQL